ncbi:sugar-binding transcriptional regulator [Geochorda subterranea]|uniref:Sugar-binding transcriptional regulator n=1 Tax=Geochorda subterranea TaxID=3109564 RepID=A0ABZ1BPH3_9FIRM|nr:sugar-binding transcriptional regulator [Limnochorda sp. LNt]WRP14726.1 sugar-binding transcriptional regulator [Limnochorda sp. LNt]
MYYSEGRSQQAIARSLGCSVSTVSRLLRDALEYGIVTIAVRNPFAVADRLAKELESRFGVTRAVVVGVQTKDESALAIAIGRAAASLAVEILREGARVGLSWGRTMLALVDFASSSAPQRAITVVPLLGGIAQVKPELQVDELSVRLARAFGGEVVLFHAPAVLNRLEAKRELLQEPSIQHAIRLWRELDVAFFGIGAEIPHSPMLSTGLYDDEEVGELIRLGAVGDIAGNFFDERGVPLDCAANRKLLAIDFATLKRIPVRIAAAGGPAKVRAICGAVRGGMVTHLVTDESTAEALLQTKG